MPIDLHSTTAAATQVLIWTPTVIISAASAVVSLISVIASAIVSAVTIRNARKLQTAQLTHDSRQRDRERSMALRRDVYIPAVEAVVASQGLLGQMLNASADHGALSRELQDNLAKIGKVQVVGSDETIAAMMAYVENLGGAFLDMTLAHHRIKAGQIPPDQQMNFVTDSAVRLSTFIAEAVIAARRDLDLPIDADALRSLYASQGLAVKRKADEIMDRLRTGR